MIGRALLIISYGVSSLPLDGLQAMEESLGISLMNEISTCFNIVLEKFFLGSGMEQEE